MLKRVSTTLTLRQLGVSGDLQHAMNQTKPNGKLDNWLHN